jgi:hypothetical protein
MDVKMKTALPTLAAKIILLFSFIIVVVLITDAAAEPVVPGTGTVIPQVGDNFEDENWKFEHNFPKSTQELNKNVAYPTGFAKNDRWYEGIKRGQPDTLKQVPTPKKGIEGSKGSLLLRSVHTGIYGRPSNFFGQDDFIANVAERIGGAIPVSQTPSVVVRVFMPKVAEWEHRSGTTFAFRTDLKTTAWHTPDDGGGLFGPRRTYGKQTYWPGMMIQYEPKEDTGREYDTAYFNLRSDSYGHDFKSKTIGKTGWWTLGISVTPDGKVHYYASEGVDALSEQDHITTRNPYGYRAEHFATFFFDVCNKDDGRTPSTAWIIDDPAVYTIKR